MTWSRFWTKFQPRFSCCNVNANCSQPSLPLVHFRAVIQMFQMFKIILIPLFCRKFFHQFRSFVTPTLIQNFNWNMSSLFQPMSSTIQFVNLAVVNRCDGNDLSWYPHIIKSHKLHTWTLETSWRFSIPPKLMILVQIFDTNKCSRGPFLRHSV